MRIPTHAPRLPEIRGAIPLLAALAAFKCVLLTATRRFSRPSGLQADSDPRRRAPKRWCWPTALLALLALLASGAGTAQAFDQTWYYNLNGQTQWAQNDTQQGSPYTVGANFLTPQWWNGSNGETCLTNPGVTGGNNGCSNQTAGTSTAQDVCYVTGSTAETQDPDPTNLIDYTGWGAPSSAYQETDETNDPGGTACGGAGNIWEQWLDVSDGSEQANNWSDQNAPHPYQGITHWVYLPFGSGWGLHPFGTAFTSNPAFTMYDYLGGGSTDGSNWTHEFECADLLDVPINKTLHMCIVPWRSKTLASGYGQLCQPRGNVPWGTKGTDPDDFSNDGSGQDCVQDDGASAYGPGSVITYSALSSVSPWWSPNTSTQYGGSPPSGIYGAGMTWSGGFGAMIYDVDTWLENEHNTYPLFTYSQNDYELIGLEQGIEGAIQSGGWLGANQNGMEAYTCPGAPNHC